MNFSSALRSVFSGNIVAQGCSALLGISFIRFMSESKENVAESLRKRNIDPKQKGEITV